MCDELPVIRVNEIGEFIRHYSCLRRLKLEMNEREVARRLPFHERLFGSIDPVLQEIGRIREDTWENMLLESGYGKANSMETTTEWNEFIDSVSHLHQGQYIFAREVSINGRLGAFEVSGRIDFLILTWEDGLPILRIVECKSSRRDRTYHRIQVAIYRQLVAYLLQENPIQVDGIDINQDRIRAFVARVDEETNSPQSILNLPQLDLSLEDADILNMMSSGGIIEQVFRSDLEILPYQLDSKCDGCIFNTDCLPESAINRKIELIGLSPDSIRSLNQVGITTLDDLANLDYDSDIANSLQADVSFTENINTIIAKASTRVKNLPFNEQLRDNYDVVRIPNSGYGTLPEHEVNGLRLIRVYLCVDYDYSENRIGAVSAHITTSERLIHTPFHHTDAGWRPYPQVMEISHDQDTRANIESLHNINGREVIHFINSPWTGNYHTDNGAERHLIETFLNDLADAMDEISPEDDCPVHFYIWSQSEMQRLVEGCSRVDSRLLGHLRHLMGCRESLEQLIFSSLGHEVNQRFALAWTGRALTVATSLQWFGRSYHWSRYVGRSEVQLDHAFTQDLFDFKTRLEVNRNGTWARPDEGESQLFEIRSRFFDSLPAPYWRALWGTLPSPDTVHDSKVARMIERYNRAGRSNYFRSYLRARTHALRWIEERVSKNQEIDKPTLNIPSLRGFQLQTSNVAEASIEFLRLEQHVRMAEWLRDHLQPPTVRVSSFLSIPVTNIQHPRLIDFSA